MRNKTSFKSNLIIFLLIAVIVGAVIVNQKSGTQSNPQQAQVGNKISIVDNANNNTQHVELKTESSLPEESPMDVSGTEATDLLKTNTDSGQTTPALPADLQEQLSNPEPELPEDLKAQLKSPPPIPDDIKQALNTPPRIVTIEEVNDPNFNKKK